MPTSQLAYSVVYNNFTNGAQYAQRIGGAIVDYAINVVMGEGAITGHAARVTLAENSLNNLTNASNNFLIPVGIYNAELNISAPTDAQIYTAVGAVWNLMCGNV